MSDTRRSLHQSVTCRAIAAGFLVTLVLQVVVIKSVHSFSHDHDSPVACSEGISISQEADHSHLDCFVCLFQFSPSETPDDVFTHHQPAALIAEQFIQIEQIYFALLHQDFYLRGPPQSIV